MSTAADSGSAAKPCPHCGAPLDRGLAEHMARGWCDNYTPDTEQTPPPRPAGDEYDEPPTLANHAEREHGDPDLESRRALADELAEKDVWTDTDAESGE